MPLFEVGAGAGLGGPPVDARCWGESGLHVDVGA